MTSSSPILIVGAGPAGLSCALWLHKLGLQPRVIDRAAIAGGLMNRNTLPNDWVLGHEGQTGPSLAARFASHIASLAIPVSLGIGGFSAVRQGDGFKVRLDSASGAEELHCIAVVLATGTRVRGPESLVGTTGLADIDDMVRYGPSAFDDIAVAAQGLTLIIGGGDNAAENAHMILAAGGEVVLLARSGFRAQAAMMATIAANPRARCLTNGRVLQVKREPGSGRVVAELAARECGVVSVHAHRLHVLTGYEPNSDFDACFDPDTRQRLQRDAQAYLQVDAAGRCGAQGVYAAGDVCNPAFPSVVSAVAQGAMVAKTIERDLRLAASRI